MGKKSNRHAFFKFFLPGSSSKKLEIPSAFTLSMQEALPEKVVLQDSYSNSWQVKVRKHRDTLYFRDGWTNFVEDNSIEGGDVVFFEYFGNGLFETKIHDSTACEKKKVGARKAIIRQTNAVNQEQEAAQYDEEEHEIKRENEEWDWEKNGASDDNYYEFDYEMGDEQEEQIPTNDHDPEAKEGTSYGVTEKATRIRRASDIYGGEIFRSELMPVPANPSFVTKINTKRKHVLKIPSAFTLSMQGALPEKVVLEDIYNNSWQVKVEKHRDNLYLVDGWENFVEDNSIERGDVLLFEYFGNGLFGIKIHDSTACRKRVRACKAIIQQNKVVNQEKEAAKYDEEEHEIKREDEDNGARDYNDHNYEFEREIADEQEKEIPTNDQAPDVKEGTSYGVIEKATRIRRVSDIYGREIFRSGLMPVPANPYFVTKINTKRKGELYIPKEVVRDNTLDLPDEIVMFDPYGRKWTGKGKIWKDGRRYYTRGWRKLCQRNFIEDDDICICEFVERDQRLTIDVSFVRAGEGYTYS